GNVHQIRDLIDEHPHTVHIKADQIRALAREFLAYDDVLSLRLEDDAVVVQTGKPDGFYARLPELAAPGQHGAVHEAPPPDGNPDVCYARVTEIAASGEHGAIHEVTAPDDNLQAVFQYLVKS